jgi:hypothetical protein
VTPEKLAEKANLIEAGSDRPTTARDVAKVALVCALHADAWESFRGWVEADAETLVRKLDELGARWEGPVDDRGAAPSAAPGPP